MKVGERNYAIDALRAVAICFVVYIHIFEINKGFGFSHGTSWKMVDIIFAISRLAVPVFFAISGWFIFSSDKNKQTAKLEKQIVKLSKILLVAVIGSSVAFWALSQMHLTIGLDTYFPRERGLFEMFFLGRNPNDDGPLWFLPSLIIVEILFWLAMKSFKNINWLAVPAFALFVVSVTFGAYRSMLGFPALPPDINETTWFVGFIWVSLGYFLAKFFREDPKSVNAKALRSFTIIAAFLFLYEYILNTGGTPFQFGPYNYAPIFIFTPFITAGILLSAAYSVVDNKVIRWLAYLGKNYSLGVFIIHAILIQPVARIFDKYMPLNNHASLRLIATYSSVVVSSFLLTALYYKVKEVLPGLLSRIRQLTNGMLRT